jgi:hypothetical protein
LSRQFWKPSAVRATLLSERAVTASRRSRIALGVSCVDDLPSTALRSHGAAPARTTSEWRAEPSLGSTRRRRRRVGLMSDVACDPTELGGNSPSVRRGVIAHPTLSPTQCLADTPTPPAWDDTLRWAEAQVEVMACSQVHGGGRCVPRLHVPATHGAAGAAAACVRREAVRPYTAHLHALWLSDTWCMRTMAVRVSCPAQPLVCRCRGRRVGRCASDGAVLWRPVLR